MRVGVDFDHTLFDTDGFYQETEQRLDTDIDHVKETVQNIVSETGKYSLTAHADRLGIPADALEAAYRTAPQHLYSQDWLREQGSEYDIVIVTRDSHTGWQDIKTRYAGLQDHDHVSDVRIVSGEDTKYFDDLDVLIDDSPPEIQAVEEQGMTGIYLDRYDTAAIDTRRVPDLDAAASKLVQLDDRRDHR
jgi:FMN phosphatase YigB (HAD superfamily)